MFVINITYKVDLQKVDQFLDEHISFLNDQYALGNFIASGRKVPRTGGIILSTIKSKTDLEQILSQDPFKAHHLADYELIEFVPNKTCDELQFLMK